MKPYLVWGAMKLTIDEELFLLAGPAALLLIVGAVAALVLLGLGSLDVLPLGDVIGRILVGDLVIVV